MTNITEFEFRHDSDYEYRIIIAAKTKYSAVQILRTLVQEPEKWCLEQIRQTRDCWLPIGVIEVEWAAMQPKESLASDSKRMEP